MKELIELLITIEGSASDLYGRAALAFGKDPRLSALLARLSQDEKLHREAMENALQFIGTLDIPAVINIGDETKSSIERSLAECSAKIDSGAATEEDLMEFIVCNEFSEWNDAFLYVVNSLKRVDPARFKLAAINCQKHKRNIERFFESDPALSAYFEKIKSLKSVWEEKILVVDDDEMVFDAIESVLSAEGKVERAANGKEALEMVRREYYAVIISDVDMPVMDGIRFLDQARETFPDIGKRFIFFSGGLDAGRLSYLKANNAKFLAKPSPVGQIKSAVAEVLS